MQIFRKLSISTNKATQRKKIRDYKKLVPITTQNEMSNAICKRLLTHPLVVSSDTILLYWSLPDEVNTHALIEELKHLGKTILLPKVISDTEMTIHEYLGASSMSEGAFGIQEPTTPSIPLNDLTDIIENHNIVSIIPGMAFDKSNHRLGRGKGYYDRLLNKFPSLYKIGVCYPFQLLDHIPADAHDITMNEVVTLPF